MKVFGGGDNRLTIPLWLCEMFAGPELNMMKLFGTLAMQRPGHRPLISLLTFTEPGRQCNNGLCGVNCMLCMKLNDMDGSSVITWKEA